jgi:2'-5' RNA ligase
MKQTPQAEFLAAPQYSIWWVPNEPLRAELQQVIDMLSKEFKPEQYKARTFVPHITVVPDVVPGVHLEGDVGDVVAALDRWVSTLKKQVPLRLIEIERGESFFQCVYAKAEVHELMLSTVNQAREIFRPDLFENKAAFMPHLSLLYGDYPGTVRDQAVSRAKDLLHLPLAFEGSSLSLWTSGIPAQEWKMVAEFEIGA